jgi:uncharacterized membrane protein
LAAAVRVGAEEAEEDFPVVDFRAAAEVPAEEARAEAGDMKSKEFIGKLDEAKIVAAIGDAEKKTSGEIRVYISQKHRDDALAAAQSRFEKLGMTKTRFRNAILIYLAPRSQKFAIIGDAGIHEICGDAFWKTISEKMTGLLKEGHFTEAVLAAIDEAAIALAKHFPHRRDDADELPNKIIRD